MRQTKTIESAFFQRSWGLRCHLRMTQGRGLEMMVPIVGQYGASWGCDPKIRVHFNTSGKFIDNNSPYLKFLIQSRVYGQREDAGD
jgi:hypothetical protein